MRKCKPQWPFCLKIRVKATSGQHTCRCALCVSEVTTQGLQCDIYKEQKIMKETPGPGSGRTLWRDQREEKPREEVLREY